MTDPEAVTRLEVSGASVTVAERVILQPTTFDSHSGQVTVLTGVSGVGKSTLLNVIGGVQRPSSGRATLSAHRYGAHVCITWVLQTTLLLGGRSVLDNAMLGALSQGLSVREATRRAIESLEIVSLADRQHGSVRDLSGGEAQRLTVARAMASPADVLLADEPTGQLDQANSDIVRQALRHDADAGRLSVIATHDPSLLDIADVHVELRKH